MNSQPQSIGQTELINVLIENINQASQLVKEISDRVMNCATSLRIEQSEKTFRQVSEEIKNLASLMEFVSEVKKGLTFLTSKGYEISMEPFSCWEKSLDIFDEMLSAFRNEDWVIVSDLLQYEICPLLEDGGKSFLEITQSLNNLVNTNV